MDSAIRKEELHTIEEIENMPENVRAELIDGEIYMMSPPVPNHQRIISKLIYRIEGYIAEKGGNCEVFPAPFGVYLNNDDYNYLEPDISVICDPSKIDNKGCHGAPDWVIEIVSPSSKRRDYIIKSYKYSEAGVREYWIVDPESRRIIVYDFENDNMSMFSFDDKVKAGIYEDLEIDFAEIKGQLM